MGARGSGSVPDSVLVVLSMARESCENSCKMMLRAVSAVRTR